MDVIVEIVKDNMMDLMICGLIFLGGIGIGAGITDMLYRTRKK